MHDLIVNMYQFVFHFAGQSNARRVKERSELFNLEAEEILLKEL